MSIHTTHSAEDCETCAAQQEAEAVGATPTAGHQPSTPALVQPVAGKCLGCIASKAGVGRCLIHEAKSSTPTPGEAARELALRIAEIHPPVVDGRWDGERSKVWVLQITGLLSRHFTESGVAVEQEG